MKRILCLSLGMLLGVMALEAPPAAFGEVMTEKCPDMAVCGELIWRIDDMAILCEDVEAGTVQATLPLSECLQPNEKLLRVSVAAWTEDRVLLVLCMRDATNDGAIRLLELGLAEDAIDRIKEYDASAQLGFLADNITKWYEVNMIGCGQQLFIAAMDGTYRFHFYSYAPDADALLPLGERPLAAYTAALPYDGDLLIVGPSEVDESQLELTRLSLVDGTTQLLDTVVLDSALRAANFAWDGSKGQLYYSVNNTVYSLSPGSTEAPKAVGTLNSAPAELRLGIVAGNRYAALSESGQLLSCDIRGSVTFTAQLRIANIVDDETVVAAARDFGVAHPGCTVSVANVAEAADLISELKALPSAYDAYVLDLRSDLYRSLGESGYIADLSGIDADMSADELRDMVFGLMVQDCLTWIEADESAVDRLSQALPPALEAFDGVDWSRLSASDSLPLLSQPDAALGDFQLEQDDSNRTALLDSGMPDIVVAPQAEGMAYWPLSVQSGGERLISQAAFVLCVNPHSDNLEAALSFAAHTWENTDVEINIALTRPSPT